MDCDVVLHRSDQMGSGNDGSGRGEGRGREGGVGGEARMGREEEEKRGVRRGGRGGALSESEQCRR